MKHCCEEWLKSQFGDDGETIADVYAEYVATAAALRKELAAARQTGDPAALDRVLHTIKGTAAMAGDTELSDLANRSRSAPDTTALDAVDRLMAAL